MKKIRCEVWSRVVGFMSPVDRWNSGKKSEWADRKPYDIRITKDLHDMRESLVVEGVIRPRSAVV